MGFSDKCASQVQLTIFNNNWSDYNCDFRVEMKKWYHAVYQIDNIEHKASIYINGENIKTFEIGELNSSDGPLLLGKQSEEGTLYCGFLDEVLIYNRLLTKTEIQGLYSNFKNAEKIDAFSQRTIINNGEIFFIAISKTNQTVTRARCDMAHELAHILLHPWSEDLELITREEFKLREKQANILASALLLPKESFIKDVSKFPTNLDYYIYLKNKWKVSIQAMVYRAYNLNVITYNQYQYLMRQISTKGWKTNEPSDILYQQSDNLLNCAVEMLIENNILKGSDIVEILKDSGNAMQQSEIEDLICLKPGTLNYVKIESSKILQIKSNFNKQNLKQNLNM
jgi:Zn-dependent peptidase ImmA (M78 family)